MTDAIRPQPAQLPSVDAVASIAEVAELRRCAEIARIAKQAGHLGANVDPLAAVAMGVTVDEFRRQVLEAAVAAADAKAAGREVPA